MEYYVVCVRRKLELIHLLKSTCAVIAASLLAAPCFAQTSNFDQNLFRGNEARATLTIPFGSQTRKKADTPRLEFGIRQYQNPSRHDWALNSGTTYNFGPQNSDFIESKIGFTLSNETTFLLNGQKVEFEREELGLGTGEKVAIGVGVTVAVVAAVIGFVEFREALGEASD